MSVTFIIGPADPAFAERIETTFEGDYIADWGPDMPAREPDGTERRDMQPVRSWSVQIRDGLIGWLERPRSRAFAGALMDAKVPFAFMSHADLEVDPLLYDWAPGRDAPSLRTVSILGAPTATAEQLAKVREDLPADASADDLAAAIAHLLPEPVDPAIVPARV